MEKYDYKEAVREDVKAYIEDEINLSDWTENREGLEEYLNDKLFIDDSVTGNASVSYFCNAWKAEECLAHNWDLLLEAAREFCCLENMLENGPEYCDVTIRCYVLGGAIYDVLDEYEENGAFDTSEDEDSECED